MKKNILKISLIAFIFCASNVYSNVTIFEKNKTNVEPCSMTANTFSSSETCTAQNGTATVSVTGGGQAPYLYLWEDGQTTATMVGKAAGSYDVTVTDNVGCIVTVTATINSTSITITTSAPSTTSSACGGATGSASVNPTNGTAPYFYSWSNGGNTQTISNIQQGIYSVQITDYYGCTGNVTGIMVNNPNAPSLSFTSVIHPTCTGYSNGSLSAGATGGTAPYDYLWSTNATTASINNLSANTYTVKVTDGAMCSNTSQITLVDQNTLPLVDFITDKQANMAYTLPVLTNGAYYTGPNGTGTPLSAGTKITTSQTVYIYADNGTCSNESSFDVTILSILRSGECGKNHSTLNEYIYANEMTGATHYRFKVTDASMTDIIVEAGSQNRFRLSQALTSPDYDAGTYVISVAYSTDNGNSFTPYGRACNVNVLTKIKNWYCGSTSTMSAYKASHSVQGAERYQYKLVGPSNTIYYIRYNSDPTFRLSWVSNIQTNTSYTVSVRTYNGSTWSAYGSTCIVTTPASGMMTSEEEESYETALDLEEIFVETYPNPNDGNFTISSSHEGTFKIVNELGQLIQKVEITKENNYQTKVENLGQGVYFVTGTSNNELITKKVVVQ